jgi:hypothetical protein
MRASTSHGAPGVAAVERLDGDAVVGLGDEPALERRALEDAGDELEPRLTIGWRKFSK